MRASILLLLLIATSALAQPTPRYSVSAAYDEARGALIVFGGFSNGSNSAETWRWDGTRWDRLSVTGPSARAGSAMTYDPVRERVVLFGGSAGPAFADTWEWDGSAWSRRATTGPPARGLAGMTYDPLRRRVLLFGGVDGNTIFGDTWAWDGASWQRLATGGAPGRFMPGFAFDEARGVAVLFGGNSQPSPAGIRNDTWLWDGTSWTQTSTPDALTPRDHIAMAYDAASQRVIHFGGATREENTDDMWEWDGARWLASPVSGVGRRAFPQLVTDRRGGRLLLYGGFEGQPTNELWIFECDRWTRVGG